MKKIILVCGARPNFMKIAPVWREMKQYPNEFKPIVLHTGQHYDDNMSDLFFRDLELPEPDIYLSVGSASHAVQTATIMIEFEKYLNTDKPDLIMVVGDVNSTLACSIVASKLLIPVAHIEAGLRSFDRSMPEEINRIVTDSLSDLLFTTCEDANKNLEKEGVPLEKIFFVGNVMIDTLLKYKEIAIKSKIIDKLNLKKNMYVVLTMHRPSNVDDKDTFQGIINALKKISRDIKIIFPIHPRTKKQIQKYKYKDFFDVVKCIEPVGYIDFLGLMINSKLVITDSGGIQEETTILDVPCLTIRENTERPVTIKEGTNILVGVSEQSIIEETKKILDGDLKEGKCPKLWDGRSAQRIVKILGQKL